MLIAIDTAACEWNWTWAFILDVLSGSHRHRVLMELSWTERNGLDDGGSCVRRDATGRHRL